MRMPLLDRNMRDSTVLPTMKCAQCNLDVHIRLIGQHQCAQQPAVPSLPGDMKTHGLSSFFDASDDGIQSGEPLSRYQQPYGRQAVESQMFPSTYKPSLQLLDEQVSGNTEDDFDFDSMLQNVAGNTNDSPGGKAEDRGVASGPRKLPDLSHTNSSVSIDSYASGLSPLNFAQIAGRTSPTANGFTLQHTGSQGADAPRLEQAREELRSAMPSPSNPNGDSSYARSPEYDYGSSRASPSRPDTSVAALQTSLAQKMASGAVSVPKPPIPPRPLQRPPASGPHTPISSGTESTMTLSSASMPASPLANGASNTISPPPLKRSWQRQNSEGGQSSSNSTEGRSVNGDNRAGSSHQHERRAASPINNQQQHNVSRSVSTGRAEGARGMGDSSSLSIGGMMRSPPVAMQRKPSNHEAQGSPPKSPANTRLAESSKRSNSSSSNGSNGADTMRNQNQQQSPPAVSIDTRICISARKPSGGMSGSMSASPHLTPSQAQSQSAADMDIPQGRKLARNLTNPSALPSKNPLDVLSSLVTPKSAASTRPPIPKINTQVGARSQSPMKIPANGNGRGGLGVPAVARSLKSAKLDSLLDDLMGEMQALSAEARTESDRESMVSTASAGATEAEAGLAKEHAARARLDSTVSTTSTSSTLSGGPAHGKRQLHCAACGTGIANMGRGTLVRSSALARSGGDVPASVQGVEHQGRVYCVRDYRKQATHMCSGCGQRCESTSSRDAVHALDAWWHRQCFNCQLCHQPFPDKSFYVFENKPYCRYDYHKLNRSLCGACQEPIEGPCAQVCEGRFHPGCFACAHCGDSLRDVYYSLDGRFYCEQHVHMQKSSRSVSKRQTSSNRKRQAELLSDDDDSGMPATPGGGIIISSPVRGNDSLLPPSSPPPFSPFPGLSQMNDGYDNDMPEHLDEAREQEAEGELLALNEDDEGEDLFGPNMERDYRYNASLDHYDEAMVDDTAYAAMDARERARVEARMRRRDMEEGRGVARVPLAFMQDLDDEQGPMRTTAGKHAHLLDMAREVADEERAMTLDDLKDMKGRTVAAWVSEAGPRQTIAREFRRFLLSYVDDHGASVYGERIRQLGAANGESLELTYAHLARARPLLAYFLANAPREMLQIMDDVAMDAVLTMFPDYARIRAEIHVRVSELPTTSSLRELRQAQLNCLVRVSGVVSRRTGVFPQLKYVKFSCSKCGVVLGPFYQDSQSEVRVSMCSNCQSKGPFTLNSEQTVYRNYQRLTLQETPGSVPPGRLPRHREVVLLWDLIDCAKPGEEIEVTGIYTHTLDVALHQRQGFPVFSTVIEANHVSKRADEFAAVRLTEEDRRAIRGLARDENVGRRIIKSIAPSIYGHEQIKTALALALFGGVAKDIGGKLRTRGDINVLLLGDPGTAKSQLLKYVEATAHRAVFTTGQGASAVGLTASVRKDPVTREWTLEGGALVLADRGVCLIDEFDKMNDADRTSIHEAMEQQSISISKAGIVTTLHARCSVIAAANPIGGRYRPALAFSQNVELTEPILSRFDVLCVVRDEVDPVRDEMLGRFVVQSHMQSHPQFQAAAGAAADSGPEDVAMDVIPQQLLRKYIMYARENVHPRMSERFSDKVAHLYAELRRESLATASIPITVRHVESMVRLAEAHARMHLRDYVRNDDIEVAIRVALEGFIGAQKMSVMRPLRRKFNRYLYARRDHFELLYYLLGRLVQERLTFYSLKHNGALPGQVEVSKTEFEAQAQAFGVTDCSEFYKSSLFSEQMFAIDATRAVITKTLSPTGL
ncbi:MCM DNA helicase complex subunit [Coemansia sp. RSA 1085]|nr:MCM DNA helicase complex subunit [Coemansia sp. RSA 1085]